MTSINEFTELKRQVEQAQQKADRAEGAAQQIMQQLKDEFDCKTLEEAQKKLKVLTKQVEEAEAEFETELEKYKKKWPNEN